MSEIPSTDPNAMYKRGCRYMDQIDAMPYHLNSLANAAAAIIVNHITLQERDRVAGSIMTPGGAFVSYESLDPTHSGVIHASTYGAGAGVGVPTKRVADNHDGIGYLYTLPDRMSATEAKILMWAMRSSEGENKT